MKKNISVKRPDPASVYDRENDSPSFGSIMRARISRRDTLRGSLSFAAVSVFAGAGIAGCSDDDNSSSSASPASASDQQLGFKSVKNNVDDQVVVPEGYQYETILPWGTPLLTGAPAFSVNNSGAEQALQIGDGHDGMYLFPTQLDAGGVLPFPSPVTDSALMCLNHEFTINKFLHSNGVTRDSNGRRTNADEVRKEINAHGVSVTEIMRSSGSWGLVSAGRNRRITAATPTTMAGPAAGSSYLQTRYSADGTRGRGTVNNCGFGWTPWGTYLACEENIQGYLVDTSGSISDVKKRYGITANGFGYHWNQVAGDASESDDEFARWDTAATGSSATEDYRNEANQFGYIVEIDPYDPSAAPVKRTAMGRFRHEGSMPGLVQSGQKIAFYMGDDARGEYCYKYVTAEDWDPARVSELRGTMLDNGTLYVAKFNEDGSGSWLALDINDPVTGPVLQNAGFSSQAEVCVFSRLAADALGATTMDRPEWSAVDPVSGEIYYTLTNNNDRGDAGEEAVNGANPRPDNEYGHIIKLREGNDNSAATSFTWDIFVFGGPAGGDPKYQDSNLSGLTLENQFASPDGLYFDHRGVLWIQTDNGGNKVASDTNDQMLAVIPANLTRTNGAASMVTPDNQAQVKRFFVGVPDCEVTGVFLSADSKTLFVNLQHPGDGGSPADPKSSSSFPYDASDRPRAATVVVTRTDGGDIAM